MQPDGRPAASQSVMDEIEAAFAEHGPRLRRVAFLLCGDWHRAEDLVQTAFVKVFASRRSLRTPEALPAYLRRTVVRAYIDESRRRWRAETPHDHTTFDDCGLLAHPAHPAHPDHAGPTADKVDLLAALAAVPPRQRACLVLRFHGDCSVDEAAAALGCSPGTVKSNTSRGLAALKPLLADGEIPSPVRSNP